MYLVIFLTWMIIFYYIFPVLGFFIPRILNSDSVQPEIKVPRQDTSPLSHFLWLFLSLSAYARMTRLKFLDSSGLYPCRRCGDPQSVSFCWEDAWDGWTSNLHQRTQRPEQSRGQWALTWLHLASVALYGYQSTACCNGLVRCAYAHARVKCVPNKRLWCMMTRESSGQRRQNLRLQGRGGESAIPSLVYVPHIIHIQSHSAWRRCYSGVAMTHWQEGRIKDITRLWK